MQEADFKSRKIAILGIGREGQAAWRYLRSLHPGIPLTLIDEAPPDRAFAGQLMENDRLLNRPLSGAGLEGFDVLIRSPGISPYRDSIRRARDGGATVTSPSTLWFAAHSDQRTICITGTKGKSTTSALLAHMLRACGCQVRLAGNIGRPLLDCDDRDVDWWVIELSSYQLADLQASPQISVLLNLSAEHLDWHGSEQVYRQDKLRLAELAGDRTLIANAADPLLREALIARKGVRWFNFAPGIHAEEARLFDGAAELSVQMPEGLPGAHNLSNTAAALTIIRTIGEDFSAALSAISSFHSLPHRLQLVGERGGIRFVNDSISSAPVATAAAIEALAGANLTLIVGGLDRGVDWTPYMSRFSAKMPDAVIGVPDNGHRIIEAMQLAGIRPRSGLHEAPNLAEAVALASNMTAQGGTVLLSPGAPSFPYFRDYRDRGRQFARMCGFELQEGDIC